MHITKKPIAKGPLAQSKIDVLASGTANAQCSEAVGKDPNPTTDNDALKSGTARTHTHTHTHTCCSSARKWYTISHCSLNRLILFTDSTPDPYPGRANHATGWGAAVALKVNRTAGTTDGERRDDRWR